MEARQDTPRGYDEPRTAYLIDGRDCSIEGGVTQGDEKTDNSLRGLACA